MVWSVPYSCNKTASEMTYLFDVFVYSCISMLLLFLCLYLYDVFHSFHCSLIYYKSEPFFNLGH